MRTSLIVAMAENRVIGIQGEIPWYVSADLKYFKQITMGLPVIMGRKTYESIGKALPGRRNLVITSSQVFAPPDADVVHDIQSAFKQARAIAKIEGGEEIFVIGGSEVYAQCLGEADRIYLTLIHGDFPGDVFFPELDEGGWIESSRVTHPPEDIGGPSFSFTILNRLA
ncbi:MAG: hypothetical protein CBB68_12565 [Rhodospirillaceae bacterium TMED8]|nr:dihydrofolate reductase [Magnetovibrio sp.]OUT48944.1 MAG: hypothetical protein CBB68_12565 [Rhodospirillaceae bacterium TMED8]|tara:strand:- start:1356 stop:1862 length:507 start_codon:yes stop_codon:yes gene_type:complete